MGAELTVTEETDEDVVWMSLRRLVMGRVKDLKLSPDGMHEANSSSIASNTCSFTAKKSLGLRSPILAGYRKGLIQQRETIGILPETR